MITHLYTCTSDDDLNVCPDQTELDGVVNEIADCALNLLWADVYHRWIINKYCNVSGCATAGAGHNVCCEITEIDGFKIF